MNKLALAGTIAAFAVAAAGSASAAVVVESFVPSAATPEAGYTVIDTFNTALGLINPTGNGYKLLTSSSGFGALPGTTPPPAPPFLSVLGNGGVTIDFAALDSRPVTAFEFDWGSIDEYNHLVIHSSAGDIHVDPGTSDFPTFPTSGNGSQSNADTNGLFKVVGNPGVTFSGMTLTSAANSFEIDNLAVPGPVPEPATWAMMIIGFGAIGLAMRRRSQTLVTA